RRGAAIIPGAAGNGGWGGPGERRKLGRAAIVTQGRMAVPRREGGHSEHGGSRPVAQGAMAVSRSWGRAPHPERWPTGRGVAMAGEAREPSAREDRTDRRSRIDPSSHGAKPKKRRRSARSSDRSAVAVAERRRWPGRSTRRFPG